MRQRIPFKPEHARDMVLQMGQRVADRLCVDASEPGHKTWMESVNVPGLAFTGVSDAPYRAICPYCGGATTLSGRCLDCSQPSQHILGCAGVAPIWHGRAFAWMLLSAHVRGGADLLWIFREVKAFLNELQRQPRFRRVETTVQCDFTEAGHFGRMLGFQNEGIMPLFDMNGADHLLMARIAWQHAPGSRITLDAIKRMHASHRERAAYEVMEAAADTFDKRFGSPATAGK